MSVHPDTEIYILIKRAIHTTTEEAAESCRDIQACIDRGASLNRHEHTWTVPLWYAIEERAPTEIVRILYSNNKAAKHIQGMSTSFGNSGLRMITYMRSFEMMLSQQFGHYFRNMFDCNIVHMDYILKVLEVLEITETDVDWDAYLKVGLCD